MNQVSKRQQRLAQLLRATSGPFRVEDAMRALKLDRSHAAKLLAGWHKQGVIRRVAHGLYTPISPSALDQTQVLEDPWVLVPTLYDPGYVGGWSALEHWELTEQLFRTVCVLTSKRTTFGEVRHQGVGFFIKHIPEKLLFGTKVLWRGKHKILISDPHKTVLDILDNPVLGAGLQHVIDCISEYKKQIGQEQNYEQLLQYAIQINNGALFKKLGFIAETLDLNPSLVAECATRLTTGYAHLDKNMKDKVLVTRWRLWVPKDIKF